jgi:hypothetical protein
MSTYRILADAVLTIHFAIVVFVISGLVFVVVGNRCGWRGSIAGGFVSRISRPSRSSWRRPGSESSAR